MRFLYLTLEVSLLCSSCSTATDKRIAEINNQNLGFRPNIVWITCEDIGPILPMYGDSTIKTPNLSRLAKEGIVFDNAFSVAGVCSPSRSSLITGMYPTTIGTHNHRSATHTREEIPIYEAVLPPNVKCFTEYLRQAGYYCTNDVKTDYNFGGGINITPESAFDLHKNGADWRNRKPGQPFFTIINHNITHMFQLWKRNDKPLRVNIDRVPVPPYFPTTPKARTSIARLYDNIMILDEQVGNILKKLEEDGLMDSTIIFFFSDHGDGLPRNKIWLYDTGIRVPLIVRFPNNWKAGTREDNLISFVDFAPTVMSLCGVNKPKHLQGHSFFDNGDNPRQYVYASKDRIDYLIDKIRAVRDKEYKYIRNYYPDSAYLQYFPWSDNIYLTQEWKRLFAKDSLNEYQKQFFRKTRPEEELFDIINDPYEIHNLASDERYKEVLERMRNENEKHIVETKDLGFTAETKLNWWIISGRMAINLKQLNRSSLFIMGL